MFSNDRIMQFGEKCKCRKRKDRHKEKTVREMRTNFSKYIEVHKLSWKNIGKDLPFINPSCIMQTLIKVCEYSFSMP